MAVSSAIVYSTVSLPLRTPLIASVINQASQVSQASSRGSRGGGERTLCALVLCGGVSEGRDGGGGGVRGYACVCLCLCACVFFFVCVRAFFVCMCACACLLVSVRVLQLPLSEHFADACINGDVGFGTRQRIALFSLLLDVVAQSGDAILKLHCYFLFKPL